MSRKNQQPQTKEQRKKKRMIILGVIVAIILFFVIFIASVASKNVKAMNSSVDALLNELKAHYTVTAVDPGEYKDLKIYGIMKFKVEQYDIEEIGNLSIMRVNMGVMQMSTMVITPFDKNLPLLSADYMYILSNRKAYLEFYDVVKEKDEQYNQLMTTLASAIDKYNYIEGFEASSAWYDSLLTVDTYKSATSKQDADIENMLVDSVKIYCEHAKQLPLLSADDKAEKLDITQAYTNGLVERGGVSTDVFKKELGEDETKRFFDKVFFGTATAAE